MWYIVWLNITLKIIIFKNLYEIPILLLVQFLDLKLYHKKFLFKNNELT